MQKTVIKLWLFTLLFIASAFCASAQEPLSGDALLQRLDAVTNRVRTEMLQSPQAAAPLFDDLASSAANYYQSSRDYDIYLQVMSGVFQYYQWVQKSDSLVRIASRMHDEAMASGVQTLSLAAAKYMKAWAAVAQGRQNEAMRWLEDAHEAGRERAKTERNTYAFTLYTEMLLQLIQGYGIRGSFERAYEVVEEAEPAVLLLNGRNSQQYLGLLMNKCELFYRLGRVAELTALVTQADSVFRQLDNMDPQIEAYFRSGIANMKQTLGIKTATEDELKGNDLLYMHQQATIAIQENRLDDALQIIGQILEAEERQGLVNISEYTSHVQGAVNIYLARRSFTEALALLEHAEQAIDSLCKIDPYARRKIEVLHASVLNGIGSNKAALQHIQKAKNMYDLAGDHGIEYYCECILLQAMICLEMGDLAYAKLYIDDVKQFYESMKRGVEFADSEALQSIELTFSNIYAMMGYKSDSIEKLEELIAKHEGDDGAVFLNPHRIPLILLLLKDRQWSRARRVLNGFVTDNNQDMKQRLEMGLLMCDANERQPQTSATLKFYTQAVHDNIKAVMDAFSPLERHQFWENQAYMLACGHNATLFLMPDNQDIICQCYDNALYIKSMQDKKLHQSCQWQDVARQLKPNEVAIEFIVTPCNFYDDDKTRFGALILCNDGQGPRYVDLCPTEDVEPFFRDVIHTDTALINSLYADNDSRLYQLLWQPMESLLPEGGHVYYTPTGVLSQINHEALHDADRHQLGERFALHRLTTTADIETIKHRQWSRPQRAVIYGGITYDESDEQMQLAAQPYNHEVQNNDQQLMAQRSLTSRGAITELEGTREEALYAREVLESVGCHTALLTDHEANEESVKALHHQAPELLHFGTHGFMLSTNQDQWQHRSLFEQAQVSGNIQQSMLLCSGLLMAGSFRAWRGEPVPQQVEDGILTAYELSQIDLAGCRLVVLSACETGNGFINNTTGDVGLTRALKLAGAEQVMVSLWEVPDEATSSLMRAFYDNIAEGKDPGLSLTMARSSVRSLYPNPYYWAGFVLIK